MKLEMNRQYEIYLLPLLPLVCLFFFSCKEKSEKEIMTDGLIVNKEKKGGDTSGFFKNCEELNSSAQWGILQGVDIPRDSLEHLCFAQCFSCSKTFEIVARHPEKAIRESDTLFNYFNRSCSEFAKPFECFAFVCPMRNPDLQDDPHASNIDFPVDVTVYERIVDDEWRFVKIQRVKSLSEYTNLQYRIIYNKN